MLESNLLQLANVGISDAIIVIRPEKAIIRDYLGDMLHGVTLTYVHQTTMFSREGLPDAILAARNDADLCFMLMGDVYFTDPTVVRNLRDAMRIKLSASVGVATWDTDEPHRFGIVNSHNGWVIGVKDKPKITGIHPMWGAVAFRKGFWRILEVEHETLSNALHRATSTEHVFSMTAPGRYLDLGTPASFIEGVVRVNTPRSYAVPSRD